MRLQRHRGWFQFDANDPIYRDHFPGHAVVPGSLIIAAFFKAAAGIGLAATALSRFRFRTFISPGTYAYELTIDTGIIRCCLRHEGRAVVTGKVFYDT